MPSILSLDKEKKLIYEHFFNFLAEIRIFCSNIPLKKKDFPLFFKLKHELKQGEMPNFIEIENVFLKTQEREKKFKSKWQKEEIELFLFVIFYLSKKMGTMPENFEREQWQFISKFFFERNWKQCWLKWRNQLRFNPLSRKWSKDEDSHLVEIIRVLESQKKPLKWTKIADQLFEGGLNRLLRLGKHCRERWNNHLNPTLNKGEWTDEEDFCLITFIHRNGKKWSQVSREMSGRNEYSVKNRFYYLMKTNKFDANQVNNEELAAIANKKKEIIENKRKRQIFTNNVNNFNQIKINQINSYPIQNLMNNYQRFVNYQNFCQYKRNMDNMFFSMQQMNYNSNLKIEEETKKKLKQEESHKKDQNSLYMGFSAIPTGFLITQAPVFNIPLGLGINLIKKE